MSSNDRARSVIMRPAGPAASSGTNADAASNAATRLPLPAALASRICTACSRESMLDDGLRSTPCYECNVPIWCAGCMCWNSWSAGCAVRGPTL